MCGLQQLTKKLLLLQTKRTLWKKMLHSAPSSWRGTDSASPHYYLRSRTGQIIDCWPRWRNKTEQEWGEDRKHLVSGLGNKHITQFIAEKKFTTLLQVKLKTSAFRTLTSFLKQTNKKPNPKPTNQPKQFNTKIWTQHRVLHYYLIKTFFQLKKLWNLSQKSQIALTSLKGILRKYII